MNNLYVAVPIPPKAPVITTILPSNSFFSFFIFACSSDQYSTSKISFFGINLYLEVSSTDEITLAFVSVKSAAIFAALRLLPTQNIPIFCTIITPVSYTHLTLPTTPYV